MLEKPVHLMEHFQKLGFLLFFYFFPRRLSICVPKQIPLNVLNYLSLLVRCYFEHTGGDICVFPFDSQFKYTSGEQEVIAKETDVRKLVMIIIRSVWRNSYFGMLGECFSFL